MHQKFKYIEAIGKTTMIRNTFQFTCTANMVQNKE